MSWGRALETIDARVRMHLEAESTSLRHWRMVIGKVYVDFQANFLGSKHNSFAACVLSVDGRVDGSTSPNLVMPSERERYGF